MFPVLCDRVRRKWKGFFFAKRVGRNRLPHPYQPKSLYMAVEDGQRALVWLGESRLSVFTALSSLAPC